MSCAQNGCPLAFTLARVPNQTGQPAVLLSQAWREGARSRKKTVATLSLLPAHGIKGFRTVLQGGGAVGAVGDLMPVERSLAHGQVMAVLGPGRRRGVARLLHRQESRPRPRARAAVVARVLNPASTRAPARRRSPATAPSSLGPLLALGPVTGNELLALRDWLLARPRWIERVLARRPLEEAPLLLDDGSRAWLEGRLWPRAACGHTRAGKRGKPPVVCGLLCRSRGGPVRGRCLPAPPRPRRPWPPRGRGAARASPGPAWPSGGGGDRGRITPARIREALEPAGRAWGSALKTADLRRLRQGPAPARSPEARGADLGAESTRPDFPGERLMVCLTPRLRAARRRQRAARREATEEGLEAIAASGRAGPLKGAARIGPRGGRDATRRQVAKHFDLPITDPAFPWRRRQQRIDREARLDGLYVVRPRLEASAPAAAGEAYQSLAPVERACRGAKSELKIRPGWGYPEDHVRRPVFRCRLAWYGEWHLRPRRAPLLFEDEDREAARRPRAPPVEQAQTSPSARRTARPRPPPAGLPGHSFRPLIDDLASGAVHGIRLPGDGTHRTTSVTQPPRLQRRACQRLALKPDRTVPINRTG